MTATNWEAFAVRASFVRKLTHDEGTSKGGRTSLISPQVVSELSYCTPDGGRPYLPNVRHVTWTAKSDQTVAQLLSFISPELQGIYLTLQGSTVHTSAPRTLHLLGDRCMKNLQCFSLKTDYDSDDDIQAALGHCLERQRCLSTIEPTRVLVSPNIANYIRFVNTLRKFRVNLTIDSPSNVRRVSQSLSSSCPSLSTLYISDGAGAPNMDWSTFSPLLACTALRDLEISSDRALIVSADDIQKMGKAWPEMYRLALAGSATRAASVPSVGTPFACLADFAESLPKLESLAVHFSYDQDLPSAEVAWTSFQNLNLLSVGASQVPKSRTHAVAEFVLALCPDGVKLACYSASPSNVFDQTGWIDRPERESLKEVKRLIDFVGRIRSRWGWERRGEPSDTSHQ